MERRGTTASAPGRQRGGNGELGRRRRAAEEERAVHAGTEEGDKVRHLKDGGEGISEWRMNRSNQETRTVETEMTSPGVSTLEW